MCVFYAFILRMPLGFLSVKLRGEVAESLSQLCPKCSKMASENHQKSKKMWPRLDPGRANGILDRLWAGGWYYVCLRGRDPRQPGKRFGLTASPFWQPFSVQKLKKTVQKDIKKMKPKNYGITMTESDQNGNTMDGKIIDFPSFWRKSENAPNYLFYNIKRASGWLKMHEKSMRNRTKIWIGKRRMKNREKDVLIAPNLMPKSIRNHKNAGNCHVKN